jgi:hypothetical protein
MQQNLNSAEKAQNGADALLLHFKRMEIIAGGGVYTHVYQWLNTNRRTYPGFIFRAGIIAAGIVLATIAMHVVSTGFGRIVEDVILQAGAALLIIAFVCVVLFMLWGTHNAFKYRAEHAPVQADEPKSIPAETARKWQPLSIAPDTLFFQQNGETMAEFAARVSAFTPTMSEWGILVKRGELQVTVLTPGAGIHFEREDEPFLPMLKEDEPRPRGVDHLNESQEDFEKYCYWLSLHLKPWTTIKKYEHAPNEAHKTAVEILKAEAKTVTVVLSLLLLCLPVFGQSKARQVDEVLGTRIREIPQPGEKVTFVFREGSKDKYYERTGDGKSEYTDLLQKTSGLVKYNDHGGELVAIMKNGEAIAKAAHVERVNEVPKQQSPVAPNGAVYLPQNNTSDPIRPRGTLQGPDVANTPVTDEPTRFSMPDSSTTAGYLEDAKHSIDDAKGKIWQQVLPIWRFVLYLFSSIVILLICLIGLCRYVAKSAANESVVNTYGRVIVGGWIARAQQEAASMTLFLTWIIAIVVLVDVFMWLVMLDLPIWTLIVIWFPTLWAAEKLTDWIVPNANIVGIEKALNPYNKP